MSKLSTLILLGLLAVSAPLQGATAFLQALADVPLMAGLREQAEGAVNFDTPAGRIVEVRALGPVAVEAVTGFYDTSLIELGWRRGPAALTFLRGGEVLTLSVKATRAGQTEILFRLSPEPSGARP